MQFFGVEKRKEIVKNIFVLYFKGEFGNCSIEPITLGHEFSGVVVESGVNVLLKKGTKVQYVN